MTPRAVTLFLPLRHPRVAWITSLAIALYYSLSSSKDLTFYDSAELALVAEQLGLSHPIGQPLHACLGFVFSHLPFVAPLHGLTWLSILPAALSVLPTLSLSERLVPAGDDTTRSCVARVVCVTLVFVSPPVWQMATRIEVYPLATFLTLMFFARVSYCIDAHATASKRQWLLAGVLLGLVGATNAYMALLSALAFAPALFFALRARTVRLGDVAALAGGGFLGLLPYAYVPIVAHSEAHFVWGDPDTLPKLVAYFRGADYERNRGTTLSLFAQHSMEWIAWSARTYLLPFVLLGVSGHVSRGASTPLGRGTAALLMALTVALLASHRIFFPDIPDYVDYTVPAILLLSAGVAALVSRAFGAQRRSNAFSIGLIVLVMLAMAFVSKPGPLERAAHRDYAARTIAEGALRELPRNAILVAAHDHWVAPLIYLQEAEHLRPDVVVIAYGLASSSWYWEFVRARHTDLAPFDPRSANEPAARVRAFLSAQRGRDVFVADPGTLSRLALAACDVGFTLRVGADCDATLDTQAATRALADAMNAIDLGSPTGMQGLAHVAFGRSRSLFMLGRSGAAVHAALAGIPPSMRPPHTRYDLSRIRSLPRFDAAERIAAPPVALGSPERNLALLNSL